MNDRHADGHTPGPWIPAGPSFGRTKPAFFATVVTEQVPDNGDDMICQIEDWPFARGRQNANARLIAAAPTLLAALRDAREHIAEQRRELSPPHGDPCDIETCDMTLATIDAAIEAVRGRPDPPSGPPPGPPDPPYIPPKQG